jgi:hypothetical protein
LKIELRADLSEWKVQELADALNKVVQGVNVRPPTKILKIFVLVSFEPFDPGNPNSRFSLTGEKLQKHNQIFIGPFYSLDDAEDWKDSELQESKPISELGKRFYAYVMREDEMRDIKREFGKVALQRPNLRSIQAWRERGYFF